METLLAEKQEPLSESRADESTSLPPPSRDDILRLQDAVIQVREEPPEPTHFFAPGMYLRELTIPAGMIVVGKTHRHAHFFFVLKGKALVVSEFGRDVVEAGFIKVSQAGDKRVFLTIEETKIATVHVNKDDTNDLDIIEAEHIIPEEALLGFGEKEKPECLL